MSFGSPCIRVSSTHTQAAPPDLCQKRPSPQAPSRRPYTAAHVSQILMRLGSPYGPRSHTFPRFPIQPPSFKNPDIGFGKASVSGPANQAPAGLCEFPASTAGAVPHVRTGHRPAETSVRFTQTYAPNRFTQIPCTNGGEAGAVAWHRFATRRRRGPRVQVRPKAGACGPGRGSPKNLDRLDSAKVRRRGAGSRRTDGRSRRPPARPGVMHALRRWGTVSLPF